MREPDDRAWVGRACRRKEDKRLTSGRGQYLADLKRPGLLHVAFARSSHARARLVAIDTIAARGMPGVVTVVTGAELVDAIRSLPRPVVAPAFPARYPTFWPLAVGKVKFHGEPLAAVVEVSAATGQFRILRYLTSDDFGTVINPLIIEGQVQGTVAQGISNTIYEEFVYDRTGQQLTTDFENYQIANAADLPNIAVSFAGVPTPHTPLGSRGAGEGIPGPVPAALASAVSDALQPFGIEITELPLRPNRIWLLIQAAKRA
ncbi:MAG: hypothetical protein FJX56_02845 [Alphaproteobacteria bacterium]|nr:hypothetical protein [Alphaproteobacteria bacterium]